ncbi:dihydrofolate reductase family protein [Labedaea rhizosphaerae]|uniref:Dihydrofolate reductase n=1 Tax=Labedaea rhizosphaerae TaxID=598644 RepID=A0A4R6RZ46_LABRH|nr:dihydrofolate reductase family protein [Labedaea rhizosphaerae]TDP92184.1 dihydrofolate reductase [Labedaea rhizosphaerae]
MSKIAAGACMSLDGFIAGPEESGFEHLFAWLGNGDVEVPTAQPERTLRTSAASAEVLREHTASVGALVVGRRLFDLTKGWGGTHPWGVPVFVVTHSVPEDWANDGNPFTFVTDGVASAVEQAAEVAGVDKMVGVNGGEMARQCLELGLLDEVGIDLVPVLLGDGVPMFGKLAGAPVRLANPTVVEGDGVTHLRYRVLR